MLPLDRQAPSSGCMGLVFFAGGVGDYLNIFDSGDRDYNFTRQGYENIFQTAGQSPKSGANAFHLTDAFIGVGALMSPVKVKVVGPATITGETTIPAYKKASRAVIAHDAVQITSSVKTGMGD